MYTFQYNATDRKYQMFLDGNPSAKGTERPQRNFDATATQVTVGNNNVPASPPFNTQQLMDELSVWSLVLNQTQIDNLFNAGEGFEIFKTHADLPSSENLYLYYKFNDLPVTNEIFTKLGASLLGNTTATGSPTLGTGLFGEANGAHSYSSTSAFEETDLGIAGTILKDRMVMPFEETPKVSSSVTIRTASL